ncbi:hypothetical protein [Loigolactobacillus backii]|nr:hypothetical protein [Loigolactobacillus backii]
MKYNIPVTSLDGLNWGRSSHGDILRIPEERTALLNQVLSCKD